MNIEYAVSVTCNFTVEYIIQTEGGMYTHEVHSCDTLEEAIDHYFLEYDKPNNTDRECLQISTVPVKTILKPDNNKDGKK